jgi:hypothetical protein
MFNLVYILFKSLISSPEPYSNIGIFKISEGLRRHNWATTDAIDIRRKTMRIESQILKEKSLKLIKYKRIQSTRDPPQRNRKDTSDKSTEDVIQEVEAEDIWTEFLSSIWRSFPNIMANGKDPVPSLPPLLTFDSLTLHIKEDCFSYQTSRKYTWEDRFSFFFPPSDNLRTFGQGWKSLTYWDSYIRLITRDQSARGRLKGLFGTLEWLPAGVVNGKLWIYGAGNKKGKILLVRKGV